MPPATANLASGQGRSRRPRRADAQRNHDLLLAAAREIFSERGADAPLNEVARRAGIGNATMYRHFPDRRELIIAVYADEVAALRPGRCPARGPVPPRCAVYLAACLRRARRR